MREIDDILVPGSSQDTADAKDTNTFLSLRFENVLYAYTNEDRAAFSLNLSSFDVQRGQIVFIVGDNGSGKSTFVNLLTGLCEPSAGNVWINEKKVSWGEFSRYANNMAVVFSNQHLFRENYDGHDLSQDNNLLNKYRLALNIDHILRLRQKTGTFDHRLSAGQQKRMALLLAILEQKPIMILDEFAAEQDSDNRKEFYTKWLKAIRDMGVTLIVITHDTDFFHVADRVVRFSGGKISEDVSNAVDGAVTMR
jgi:ABC-type siderophore export system fused ATPase/permease subunit